MSNVNQIINRLKLLLILSLMNKINQNRLNKSIKSNEYDKTDKYDQEKNNPVINNRNLCPSVKILENLCYREGKNK